MTVNGNIKCLVQNIYRGPGEKCLLILGIIISMSFKNPVLVIVTEMLEKPINNF